MPEYIRKLDIEGKALMMYGFGENRYVPLEAINRIPAADVAPVVHGYWIPVEVGNHKCSRCHTVRKTDVARDHYCPNCGAKMDGGVDI